MTTSVVATGFGGPENLSIVESPTRAPGPGEIRVAIKATGVNPIDHKMYSGMFGADPSQLPIALGREAAGVVSAAADGAGFSVGDEVIVSAGGTYTTELVVPSEDAVLKPAGLDWDIAAALPVGGGTAAHALAAAGVESGDTVLIHGGAGGVGLFAVQLAVLRGARVIATASERNHELLGELGATPVAYGAGLADRVRAVAPDGVDAALDLVGTDEAVDVSLELVADRNRIATIAAYQRAATDGIKLLGGGPGADAGTEIRLAARTEVADLAASGKLRVVIAARYPLADAAEAHRAIMTGHTVGKIVLIP